jgi:hypothetical protein
MQPVAECSNGQDREPTVTRLRWDHGDIESYQNYLFGYLQPILTDLSSFESYSVIEISTAYSFIDCIYDRIVNALTQSASLFVPSHKTSYYKFWWDQELDTLKESAIASDRIWKAAGRPRNGPLFTKRSSDKRSYKLAIRKHQTDSTEVFTNELHESLLRKSGQSFWKCWNSKFGNKYSYRAQISGLTDHLQIANKFRKHFASICSSSSEMCAANLSKKYNDTR